MTFFNLAGSVSNLPFAVLHPIGFLVATLALGYLLVAGILPLPPLPHVSVTVDFEPLLVDLRDSCFPRVPDWFVEGFFRTTVTVLKYGAAILTYLIAVIAALLVAAGALTLGFRVLPFDFRLTNWLDNFVVRLDFTLVPLRSQRVEFDEFDSGATLLRHSAIYENPEVIERLSTWVAERSLLAPSIGKTSS